MATAVKDNSQGELHRASSHALGSSSCHRHFGVSTVTSHQDLTSEPATQSPGSTSDHTVLHTPYTYYRIKIDTIVIFSYEWRH